MKLVTPDWRFPPPLVFFFPYSQNKRAESVPGKLEPSPLGVASLPGEAPRMAMRSTTERRRGRTT